MELEPEVCRPAQVPEDAFDELKVAVARCMHEQAALLHGIREIGARQRQVLERTSQAAVERRVVEERPGVGGEFGERVHRRR